MKSMKCFMLVMLLASSSIFFAGESEPESSIKIANEIMEKESCKAISHILTCTGFAFSVLTIFDSSNILPTKGLIALSACTATYGAFVASAAYQNMSKSADENQK